jgi:hypothetical protein
MHLIRAISAIVLFSAAVFYCNRVLGTVQLNEVMSQEEQKKTGVSNLNEQQKRELESWINSKFVLKTTALAPKEMTLQQPLQNGAQMQFTDGSIYEIAPEDRARAIFWPVPLIVTLETSGDPLYPSKITNTLTNVSVRAKLVKSAPPKSSS